MTEARQPEPDRLVENPVYTLLARGIRQPSPRAARLIGAGVGAAALALMWFWMAFVYVKYPLIYGWAPVLAIMGLAGVCQAASLIAAAAITSRFAASEDFPLTRISAVQSEDAVLGIVAAVTARLRLLYAVMFWLPPAFVLGFLVLLPFTTGPITAGALAVAGILAAELAARSAAIRSFEPQGGGSRPPGVS